VQVIDGGHGVIGAQIERGASRPPQTTGQGADTGDEPIVDAGQRAQMVERLHRDVRAAVDEFRQEDSGCRGGRVNASSQPHEVTTDVLGEWVREPGPAALVRIVYADGSEAAPFPLCCLGGRPRPEGEVRVLRAALMSMRHLGIDRIVDLAWYRNHEVSQARSLAESDEFCFRYSLYQLRELVRLSRRLDRTIRLEVFHTGFEPASLGFYRALAAVLAADERFGAGWAASERLRLIVAPRFYRGGTSYAASANREGKPIEWY